MTIKVDRYLAIPSIPFPCLSSPLLSSPLLSSPLLSSPLLSSQSCVVLYCPALSRLLSSRLVFSYRILLCLAFMPSCVRQSLSEIMHVSNANKIVRIEKGEYNFSDRFLRDVVMSFVIAGRDTTAVLLSWTFYVLGQHPEINARLLQEINAHYPKVSFPLSCRNACPVTHYPKNHSEQLIFFSTMVLKTQAIYLSLTNCFSRPSERNTNIRNTEQNALPRRSCERSSPPVSPSSPEHQEGVFFFSNLDPRYVYTTS
jgi:hypothetical protein